jgi:HSF-type DNA-binding
MRQKVNGNGIRAAGNPDNEPVLTRYPTCPPVPLQCMLREQAFAGPILSSVGLQVDSSASWSELTHPAPVVTRSAVTVASRKTITTTKAPSSALPCKRRLDSPDLTLLATGAQFSFPLRLQRILDKLESEDSHDVISWLHHGRAFMVHDPDRFVSDIMTVYFK